MKLHGSELFSMFAFSNFPSVRHPWCKLDCTFTALNSEMIKPIKITDSIKCTGNSKITFNTSIHYMESVLERDAIQYTKKNHILKNYPCFYTTERVRGGGAATFKSLLMFKIK
jgi:hypothetical protein